MCGIAGILHFNSKPAEEAMIRKMNCAMAHRGPDADGFYVEGEVALSQRRLAIIDLSEAANQPFSDNSGRYKLIFNGEIYNYAEVKPLISEYDFKTTSDTEMIIAAYAKWGADCIQYFRGMFTFVIWDRQEKEIFLARDRMGVKPLYYYLDENKFLFASEIRPILLTGEVKRKFNDKALHEYFSYQSVSYPFSVVEGIEQLEAGSWMRIKNGKAQKKLYWDVTKSSNDAFDFSNTQKVQQRIRELLVQSVKRRLVSDVPVGAFLSGGIDSSVVVGLMTEAGDSSPNTFNISFDEKEYDESRYADIIAKKFRTNHTRILLKPTSFLDELQNALDAMDSPSGDGINTYVVSKAIHEKGMKVALSGVGGDELFAGYPFFKQYLQLQQKKWMWKFPAFIRNMAAVRAGARKERVKQLLNADSPSIANAYPIFRQILSPALIQRLTTLGENQITSVQLELVGRASNLNKLPLLSQVSAAEYLGYTQHTLLKDADQMSMAHALELREPYFDNDLVEFVLAIPDNLKNPVYPKSLMVESVKNLLPDEIVHRKKQGFLFPWNLWLKNELRSFCDHRIKNICQRSFINGEQLHAYWQSFLNGNQNVRWAEIWLFVVLEYWLEKNNVS